MQFLKLVLCRVCLRKFDATHLGGIQAGMNKAVNEFVVLLGLISNSSLYLICGVVLSLSNLNALLRRVCTLFCRLEYLMNYLIEPMLKIIYLI